MKPEKLFDFIQYQKQNFPLEKSIGHQLDGKWEFLSTDEVIEMANQLSSGLLELGVQKGDKIALVSYQNRIEWIITDLAVLQIGAITVPVYPTISSSDYEFIFNNAEVSYCFVGRGDLYDKARKAQQTVPSLKEIYTYDEVEGRPYWKSLFKPVRAEEIKARKAAVDPHELATLIYTSGTTGKPKGVMLSHSNIASNVYDVQELIPATQGDRTISFLPLCHIFERTASYAYLYKGLSTHFTGTQNLGGDDGDLKAVRPNYFNTVPRLLEKVYEKIYNRGLELSGIKKRLFFWALEMTKNYDHDKEFKGLQAVRMKIADRLIFSKWREALGGEVRGILTGASACPERIIQVFSAAGIPVREGYGLTETSPGLIVGRQAKNGARLGSVGPTLSHVEIMIDDSEGDYRENEGEILAKGPNVMMGYYKNEEATNKVFKDINGDRWFKTGDIGRFVPGPNGQQFLKITDRKKELLKTSGGKYVAPAPIESKLKEDFLVEQVMVVGENRKFVSAIILPAAEALQDWCQRNNVEWTSLGEVVQNPKVLEEYKRLVNSYNPMFSHTEQIKEFRLVPDNWEPVKSDGTEGELTPTMKLKRRVILKKYDEIIEDMYAAR